MSFAAASLVVGAVGFEAAFLFFALLLSIVFAKASAGGGFKLGEALRRSPAAPILAIFLEWYVLYSLFLLLPIFLNKQGFSTELIGLFFTVEAAVYGALQPLVGRLVEGNRRELVLLLALYPSSLLLIPLAPGLAPLILILFAVGSSPIFVITTHYWRRGGFDMGVLMAFGYLGSFTGPLISGLLAQLSPILSFLQLAIAGGVLAIIIITMLKNQPIILKVVVEKYRSRHHSPDKGRRRGAVQKDCRQRRRFGAEDGGHVLIAPERLLTSR